MTSNQGFPNNLRLTVIFALRRKIFRKEVPRFLHLIDYNLKSIILCKIDVFQQCPKQMMKITKAQCPMNFKLKKRN